MPARRGRGNGSKKDEQVEILRAIWGEMKSLNGRIDKTNERLDAVRTDLVGGIDALRADLKDEIDVARRRGLESEVRLATATTELSTDVKELSGLIREWRLEHRADRSRLEVRVARIESHLGLGEKP